MFDYPPLTNCTYLNTRRSSEDTSNDDRDSLHVLILFRSIHYYYPRRAFAQTQGIQLEGKKLHHRTRIESSKLLSFNLATQSIPAFALVAGPWETLPLQNRSETRKEDEISWVSDTFDLQSTSLPIDTLCKIYHVSISCRLLAETVDLSPALP